MFLHACYIVRINEENFSVWSLASADFSCSFTALIYDSLKYINHTSAAGLNWVNSIFIWPVETMSLNSIACLKLTYLIHLLSSLKTQTSSSDRSINGRPTPEIYNDYETCHSCCDLIWYSSKGGQAAARNRPLCVIVGKMKSERAQWHGYPGQTDCDYLFLTSDLQFLDVTFDLQRLEQRKITSEVPYILQLLNEDYFWSLMLFLLRKRFF